MNNLETKTGQSGFSAPATSFLSQLGPVWAMQPDCINPWMEALNEESKDKKKAKPLQLSIQGKIAVLDLNGTITPSAPSWSRRTAAMDKWVPLLKQAGADPTIKAIVIRCDSPGGNVLGVSEAAIALESITHNKPVITHVTGRMCSAAVWICAGSSMIVASESTMHGSVGTVFDGADYSKMYERMGIKEWSVTSKHAPLKRVDYTSKEGKAVLQAIVDETEELMLEHVAMGREVTVDKAIKDFGRGAVMGARMALSSGLIDAIGTWDETLSLIGGGEIDWMNVDKEREY